MNPQTPQTNGVGQTQPTQPQGQLDPSVVALTKAIGKAESGGKYNSGDNTGDGANSSGAYQFTPGFLQEWAPKAGVQYQPGTQLNPEQQDKIAYNAVKTMGTEGDPAYPHLGKLSPAQITSAWNTGNPNAYLDPEYGKNNTYGSTENYVHKVGEYYDEFNGSSSQQNSNTQPASSQQPKSNGDFMSAIQGLGAGALGWLAGNAGTAAKVGLPIAGAALGTAIEPGAGTFIGEGLGTAAANLIPSGSQGSTPQPSTIESSTQAPQAPSFESGVQQSTVATNAVKNAILEAMQGTQTNRNFSRTQEGQQAINTASAFGLIEPDENGNLVFNTDKSKEAEAQLGSALDAQIKSEDKKASPGSVINYAGSYIGKDKFATDLDRQEAADIVRKNIEATGISSNGEMSLSDMRERQKQHYAEAKPSYGKTATTAHMLAHRALGDAYGRTIRDNLPDKELYDRTKKMQQALINAKQVGKRLNGKKAPTHKGVWESFLKQGARAAEIYIGDKLGGPIGAIIGGLAGEHLNRKIEKKFGRNIFETKSMKAAMDILKETKPKEYENLVEALTKNGIEVGMEKEPENKNEKEVVKDVKGDLKTIKGKKGLIPISS